MTKIYVTTPLNRTEVYHTEYCKHVKEIRETPQHGKCLREDLTVEQVEQWGKRECRRCQEIRNPESAETVATPVGD